MDEMDITIRTASLGDLTAVDAVFARAYPALLKLDYPPSVLVTALPLISRAQPRLLASGTFYLAEINDTIVGAGGWSVGAPDGAQRAKRLGHIRHLVTDVGHTRRGIACALMRHVFKTAGAAGICRLNCQSTRTAVPFYEAMGVEVLDEISVPLRPGISFPAVAMTRVL